MLFFDQNKNVLYTHTFSIDNSVSDEWVMCGGYYTDACECHEIEQCYRKGFASVGYPKTFLKIADGTKHLQEILEAGAIEQGLYKSSGALKKGKTLIITMRYVIS